MRGIVLWFSAIVIVCTAPAYAVEAVDDCKIFFEKFQTCVDSLQGEQRDEARIFMKTLRATLGMSDSLNQQDPLAHALMCRFTIVEIKKDETVQKYNCNW